MTTDLNDYSNDLWLEKYRPKKLKDYIGNEDDILVIKEWIKNYYNKEVKTPKILILYGNPGVGKTTLARLIFKRYGFEIIEFNASNYRSKNYKRKNWMYWCF